VVKLAYQCRFAEAAATSYARSEQMDPSRARSKPSSATTIGARVRQKGVERPGLRVGECEASAESQGAERIFRVAAATPVRKLLFIEAVGMH
jgi:hypothetical protein